MSPVSLFTVVKAIHILAASLWIGGIIFTVVINRGLRRMMQPMEATKTLGDIGRLIQKPMRASLYIAVATGPLLLLLRGISPAYLVNPAFYSTQIGAMILGKIISVAAVLALLPLHSKLGSEIYMTQDRQSYNRLRREILIVGWVMLLLSLLTLLFGTGLRAS